MERVAAFVSSMPWWLRWVWILFFVAWAMTLRPQFEPVKPRDGADSFLLLIQAGAAAADVLDNSFLSKNLRNVVGRELIVDTTYQQEFTYSQLSALADCNREVLFSDGNVAAFDYCGVVLVTASPAVVENIVSRDLFEAHRAEILIGVRNAAAHRGLDRAEESTGRAGSGVPD